MSMFKQSCYAILALLLLTSCSTAPVKRLLSGPEAPVLEAPTRNEPTSEEFSLTVTCGFDPTTNAHVFEIEYIGKVDLRIVETILTCLDVPLPGGNE